MKIKLLFLLFLLYFSGLKSMECYLPDDNDRYCKLFNEYKLLYSTCFTERETLSRYSNHNFVFSESIISRLIYMIKYKGFRLDYIVMFIEKMANFDLANLVISYDLKGSPKGVSVKKAIVDDFIGDIRKCCPGIRNVRVPGGQI